MEIFSFFKKLSFLLTAAFLLCVTVSPVLAGGDSHAEEDGQASAEPVPFFARLDPITITVLKEGMVSEHITYVLILDIKGEDKLEYIDKMEPVLRSKIVNYLHEIASNRTRNYLTDFDFLKKRIKTICNNVLGEELINEVLFRAKNTRSFS